MRGVSVMAGRAARGGVGGRARMAAILTGFPDASRLAGTKARRPPVGAPAGANAAVGWVRARIAGASVRGCRRSYRKRGGARSPRAIAAVRLLGGWRFAAAAAPTKTGTAITSAASCRSGGSRESFRPFHGWTRPFAGKP